METIILALQTIAAKMIAEGYDNDLIAPIEFAFVDDSIFILVRPFDASPDVWWRTGFGWGAVAGPDGKIAGGRLACRAEKADDDDLEELRSWRSRDEEPLETKCPVCLSDAFDHACKQ